MSIGLKREDVGELTRPNAVTIGLGLLALGVTVLWSGGSGGVLLAVAIGGLVVGTGLLALGLLAWSGRGTPEVPCPRWDVGALRRWLADPALAGNDQSGSDFVRGVRATLGAGLLMIALPMLALGWPMLVVGLPMVARPTRSIGHLLDGYVMAVALLWGAGLTFLGCLLLAAASSMLLRTIRRRGRRRLFSVLLWVPVVAYLFFWLVGTVPGAGAP